MSVKLYSCFRPLGGTVEHVNMFLFAHAADIERTLSSIWRFRSLSLINVRDRVSD